MQDTSLDGCVVFNFLINGGRYEDEDHIHKHDFHPNHLRVCDIRKNCLKPQIAFQFPENSQETAMNDTMDYIQKDETDEEDVNRTIAFASHVNTNVGAVGSRRKVVEWKQNLSSDIFVPTKVDKERILNETASANNRIQSITHSNFCKLLTFANCKNRSRFLISRFLFQRNHKTILKVPKVSS